MDTELTHTFGFTLHWADVAQGLMQALPIVEHLDELKHRRPGLLAGPEVLVIDQFVLEGTKEAFDHGVVIAVALPTHTRHQPGLADELLAGPTRVCRPLIAVMDQPRSWAPVDEGHLQRRQYFPKGTDLSRYSQTELNMIALRLNQRPRKTLGFQTPAAILEAGVALTA
jgi:hypothetical protein